MKFLGIALVLLVAWEGRQRPAGGSLPLGS